MAPFTSRLPFDLSCWLSLCAKFIFIATVYENLIIVIGNSSPCIKALCSVLKSQYSEIAVVVQSLSHILLFVTPWTILHQASCPLLSPRVCWNSCPLIWWCHPTISNSVSFTTYKSVLILFSPHKLSMAFSWNTFKVRNSFPKKITSNSLITELLSSLK